MIRQSRSAGDDAGQRGLAESRRTEDQYVIERLATIPRRRDEDLHLLTHRRLESSDTVLSVSGGWHTHLNILEDVLGERELRPFYKMQLQYESEYGKRLGSS